MLVSFQFLSPTVIEQISVISTLQSPNSTLNTTYSYMNKSIVLTASIAIVGVVSLFFLSKRKKKQIVKKRMTDLIGNTPLIYIQSLSEVLKCEIYAKAEFMNPFGSSKDRAVKQIIENHFQIASDEGGKRQIIEASSGSTAISIALYSHLKGIKPRFYLPNDLSTQKYKLLELLGAEINPVPAVSIVDPQHFCNIAEKVSIEQNVFFSNQFENLSNSQAHYLTTGPEIYQDTLHQLNAFVCSAGTGGTIAGVSQYLKQKDENINIILADPQGSSLYNKVKYQTLYTHEEREGYRKKNPFDSVTEGIGLNRSTANLESAIIDDAERVLDSEALHMSRYLILNEGLFLGSSSSVNLVATVKYCRKNPGQKVVTILHDSGNRYISKFYSPQFLKSKGIQFVPQSSYPPSDISFVGK